MPTIAVNGTELHYDDTGPGRTGETIVFSHGLLLGGWMFAPQVRALRARYRCLSYDHRGQGRSADSRLRSIDMDTLTDDAAALIDRLAGGPVHVCGLSMGGFVALRLALRRPELVRSLALLATTADPEPNVRAYRRLNFVARWLHHRLVIDRVMPICFGRTALADPARAADRDAWRQALRANRRSIWRAVNGVIDRAGVADRLGRIAAPTLVVVGEEDVATPPAAAERLAAGIPGARLVRVPTAGHTLTLERPEAATAALADFLDGLAR
jgi:pimeloyl-ACP methyl ester carboxylesterase